MNATNHSQSKLASNGVREIILASASKQRYDILKRTGIPFVVEDSGYEEDLTLPLTPDELVKHLAEGKAATVAARHQDALVIGADTIVVCDKEIFGKPLTSEQAREMLRKLSGKTHSILTGFAIIDPKTGDKVARTVETKVSFRALSDAEIDAYVATGEPLGKAGGYAIQGKGAQFVEKIEGEMDNVVGLPLQTLLEELAKLGITG
ncbi:septum formation inhibitor Maf [Candidatus Kaiserbacteria bacterium]|nr:septum formation inhibitor Maf [Candidatus Kaiserbacteria bacterium]